MADASAGSLPPRLPFHAGLPLLAEALDAERHDIAGLERHEAADIADDMRDAEDHGLRAAGLHALAVDVEPHVEGLRVRDLVPRHQPRTERREGVAALAFVPLAG